MGTPGAVGATTLVEVTSIDFIRSAIDGRHRLRWSMLSDSTVGTSASDCLRVTTTGVPEPLSNLMVLPCLVNVATICPAVLDGPSKANCSPQILSHIWVLGVMSYVSTIFCVAESYCFFEVSVASPSNRRTPFPSSRQFPCRIQSSTIVASSVNV